MCHFCTYMFVSVYMLMCMHFKFSFRKQEIMKWWMGKFLSGSTFFLFVCREKQKKTNPQKVRRHRLKVEILYFIYFILLGGCWKVLVLLGERGKRKERKKKKSTDFPGTVSLSPSPLLIYRVPFFRILHIWRHSEILALIFGDPYRSPEWRATATLKCTLALSITHPRLLEAKKSSSYKNYVNEHYKTFSIKVKILRKCRTLR